jgi:predicted aminopeptidase
MLGYLNRAVPLEELNGNDETSEDDRRFVQRVEDIRRFALQELGLKKSKNYTRYVELDREYLAAVVSASAKDSFKRHEWWFPVTGKVPYKGFFNVQDARKERVKLEKKDLDVWVRGVDAFSTLGWFRDPLYSYMKKYSDRYLADLIIHELLHATVYLKGQSQFNEELAEFVGTEGARLYMEKIRGAYSPSHDDADAANAQADRAAYLTFIRGLIAELDELYKGSLPREEKLKKKAQIIETAKASFSESYKERFTTDNYRGFAELPVNNAYLELYRLYHEGDRYYQDLYERSGSDLVNFIAAARTLKGRGNPKEELEKALTITRGIASTGIKGLHY